MHKIIWNRIKCTLWTSIVEETTESDKHSLDNTMCDKKKFGQRIHRISRWRKNAKKFIQLFNVKESSLYDVKHEKKTYNVSVWISFANMFREKNIYLNSIWLVDVHIVVITGKWITSTRLSRHARLRSFSVKIHYRDANSHFICNDANKKKHKKNIKKTIDYL